MKKNRTDLVWPTTHKHPGLSNGWEGTSWVDLHLENKPLKILKKIDNRVRERFQQDKKYCSQMIGESGRLVVLALSAGYDKKYDFLLRRQIKNWSKRLFQPGLEDDLMLGKAGALIAACEVETLRPGLFSKNVIRKLQRIVQGKLESELKNMNQGISVYVGFSHGLVGYLYALECVQFTFGIKLDKKLRNRTIEAISNESFEALSGACVWPAWSDGDPTGIHGWCHGAPGIALGFICSYKLTGLKKYKQLAELGLEAASKFPASHHSFCCGSIGNAQILIEAFRITGEKKWFSKAVKLSKTIQIPHEKHATRGFHKGVYGKYYLDQRLLNPDLPLLGLGPLSVRKYL